MIIFGKEGKRLLIGTTTSVRDSGLLEYIIPKFEKETEIHVKYIAVGTGKALKMGEVGEVDLLITHAKDAELKFMKDKFGIKREEIMYNYFLLVGPKDGKKFLNIRKGLKWISKNKLTFISRDDDSGTNKKEKKLWKKINIVPKGRWYLGSGNGMGATLNITNEKQGYTISDLGTFLRYRDRLDLEEKTLEKKDLKNTYSVIVIDPKLNKEINNKEAKLFYKWITSKRIKKVIGSYKEKEYKRKLFQPIYK